MLKANCDKVLGAGIAADLWREVRTARNPDRVPTFDPQVDQTTLTNDGWPLCSCYKETSKQPDNGCRSCYGTGVIPGYEKFGYHEFSAAAIDPTVTLSSVELDTTNTAHMLRLTSSAVTGTITTVDMPATNPDAHAFEYEVQSYIRQAGGTVAVHFSVDAGATWAAIATINTPTPPVAGNIRFRVTLARTLTTVRSPFFEILRVRHARMDEPYIRVLKGLPTRQRSRDGMGVTDSAGLFRWWTVPLRHMDPEIAQDPDVTVPPEDNLVRPQAFIQFREGALAGERFELLTFEYHDPFAVFISQGFSCRFIATTEIQSRVF